MPGHVLWVCETYPPDRGGLAVAGQRISQALAPDCLSLRRLTLDARLPPALTAWDESRGVLSLGPMPEEDETLQLVEQVVAHLEPLDLVHAFYAGPLAAAAVAGARRRGLPHLISLRGNDLDRGFYRAKGSALLQWTLARAQSLTCVSREQVAKLQTWFGRGDGRYIPNSVDCGQFYPDAPLEDFGRGPLVAFVGEMRWKKGLSLVLELARGAAFRIALVGGVRGKEKQALRQWLQDHPGDAANLVLLDYQPDRDWLRRLYCRADLVWLPAWWEGMPNALLEAMACGRPVLANRVGGVNDLLTPETGWSLALSELHRLPQQVGEILALPQARRQEVGQRARAWVMEHHRPEQERSAYLELYRQLLQDRGQVPRP